jgi:hypothetical protein
MRKLRILDSENTPLLSQRNQYFYSAKAFGWKKPFEGGAGTVPLRRRGERSLKPSIFFLTGEKDACFCIQKPEQTVFSTPILIFPEDPPKLYLSRKWICFLKNIEC